jgi:uncharacterized protein YsxB (DUF464 family)
VSRKGLLPPQPRAVVVGVRLHGHASLCGTTCQAVGSGASALLSTSFNAISASRSHA